MVLTNFESSNKENEVVATYSEYNFLKN
jgi:hypothetical protein